MSEDAPEANPDNHERDDDEQLRKLHRKVSSVFVAVNLTTSVKATGHRSAAAGRGWSSVALAKEEGPHYFGGVAGGVAGAAGAGVPGAGADAGTGALCCAGFAGAGGGAEPLSTDPGPR
jgi:hypothetical protein